MSIVTSLVAFGESTFRGWGASGVNNSYMVPQMVGTVFGMGNRFRTVENMAVSGADIPAQMKTPVVDANNNSFPGPLIVENIAGTKGLISIMNFGINDAYIGVAPNDFKNNLLVIIDRLRRAGKIVFLQTPNKINNDYVYKDKSILKDGITVAQRNDQNAQKMREVASQLGLPLSDVNALTLPMLDAVHRFILPCARRCMAYGYVFNKAAVDTPYPGGVLAGVTTDPATVVTATANF